MIKIKDVTQHLESIAPISLQESYDNSGLIVGDPEVEVTGIVVCLDSVEETIQEAIEQGANLVVAHHPILFKGIKRLNGSNYVERTLIKAVKNDIAIYAIHTNLDNIPQGVNAKIASKLGLIDVQILQPKKGLSKLVTYCPVANSPVILEALFNAGAGEIGNYSNCSFSSEGRGTFMALDGAKPFVGKMNEIHKEREAKIEVIVPHHLIGEVIKSLLRAHPYEKVAYDLFDLMNDNSNIGSGAVGILPKEVPTEEFLHRIKSEMKAGMLRHTKVLKPTIKKVALCGGSGSFLLSAAKKAGADLFLTSDFKYHEFFDAENQIVIADIGHYESEQYTSELLKELLTQKFSTFAIRISGINTNPVNYL